MPLLTRSLAKVFEPAKVWVPVVTTPPLDASAGVSTNSLAPLITAPLALEVAEIAPIVRSPAFPALTAACTNSVVAILVELSATAAVGAVGVPVKAGDASGAFASTCCTVAKVPDTGKLSVVEPVVVKLTACPV